MLGFCPLGGKSLGTLPEASPILVEVFSDVSVIVSRLPDPGLTAVRERDRAFIVSPSPTPTIMVRQ